MRERESPYRDVLVGHKRNDAKTSGKAFAVTNRKNVRTAFLWLAKKKELPRFNLKISAMKKKLPSPKMTLPDTIKS